jgi:hypothetical protein
MLARCIGTRPDHVARVSVASRTARRSARATACRSAAEPDHVGQGGDQDGSRARRKGSDADASPAIICVTTLFVRQVGRHRSWDTSETRRQHGLKQAQIGPPLSGWVGPVIGHTLLGRGGVVVSYRTLHRYTTTELGFSQRKTTVRVADCARSAIGRVVHVAYQAGCPLPVNVTHR